MDSNMKYKVLYGEDYFLNSKLFLYEEIEKNLFMYNDLQYTRYL